MRRLTTTSCLVVACLSIGAAACGPPERTSDASALPSARGSAPAPASATAPRVVPRPRVVFLGDSLTAGLGLPKDQAVPALIQKRLDQENYGYEVVNAGVSGDTSAGGLSRLDWSLEGDVRVLVIELGANDGLRGLPVAQLRQNLSAIVSRAKQRGIAVLLTGMEAPPNYGAAYTAEFRQVFRDVAREHGVAFMPFFLDGVAGVEQLNQGDGMHPNLEGARRVEQALWPHLEPLLDEKD